MSLVSIFVTKSQFGLSIFFCLNLVPSVSGTVTPLKGCHVSILGFFDFCFDFWFFFDFFK